PSYEPRLRAPLWTTSEMTAAVDVRRVSKAPDTPLDGVGGTTQRSGRPNSTSLALQVGELGTDAQLGGAPEDRVDVGVDLLDDPAREVRVGRAIGGRLRAEVCERGLDLVQALL